MFRRLLWHCSPVQAPETFCGLKNFSWLHSVITVHQCMSVFSLLISPVQFNFSQIVWALLEGAWKQEFYCQRRLLCTRQIIKNLTELRVLVLQGLSLFSALFWRQRKQHAALSLLPWVGTEPSHMCQWKLYDGTCFLVSQHLLHWSTHWDQVYAINTFSYSQRNKNRPYSAQYSRKYPSTYWKLSCSFEILLWSLKKKDLDHLFFRQYIPLCLRLKWEPLNSLGNEPTSIPI